MEDVNFYEQRILSLLEATPNEFCARLKQRLNQTLVREGYAPFNVRNYGCRKFAEFLKVRLGDRVNLEWPASKGDVMVSLKGTAAASTSAPPVPPREQPSSIRTDVWQAFTNPDLKRKRYLNLNDHRILHFVEGATDEYVKKFRESQQDYVEIEVLSADVQIGWMREFVGFLSEGELDVHALDALLSAPFSTGVNTAFTKMLGSRAEEWRKIRTHKISEHILAWATQNNIHLHDLRPKAKREPLVQNAGAASVAPVLGIREQAIKLLERMSEDEIARLAIPVLLGSVLSKAQL